MTGARGWRLALGLAVILTHGDQLPAVEPEVEATDAVALGNLDEKQALRTGLNGGGAYRLADTKREFSWWCVIGVANPESHTISKACLAELRRLQPAQRVLITPILPAVTAQNGDQRDCLVEFGARVPEAVVVAVLRAVRSGTTGRLLVQAGNDEPGLISVGIPRPGAGRTLDARTWERIATAGADAKQLRPILAGWQAVPVPTAPSDVPAPRILLDLDLRSADGQPPVSARQGTWKNVTWTPAGLELRGAPLRHRDGQVPQAPYVAEVPVPGISSGGRATTVTLILWQAQRQLEVDNLFTLGRRSRWLAAHVEADGNLRAGLGNRFLLLPKLGDRPPGVPLLTTGAWHVVSIALAREGARMLIAVDGEVSRDLVSEEPPWGNGPTGPRRFDAPSEDSFSFVDFGSARHVHGVVQRVIVHTGFLEKPALIQLHSDFDRTTLPAPSPLPDLPFRARPSLDATSAEPPEKNDQPLNF